METQVRAFLNSLQAQNRYATNTILGYQHDLQHFSKFIQHQLGRPPEITDFSAEQIRDFLQAERDTRRPSTLRRRSAALKRLAVFLIQNGEIEYFNFPRLDQILPGNIETASSEEISGLSESEVVNLMSAVQADPRSQARRDEALLKLMLETGLSVSQVVALDLADFDPRSQRLQLHQSPNQTGWFSLTESGPILQKYLQEGRPELNPVSEETALFISQMGRRLSRQGIWQICQRWGRRVRLPGGLSPRNLRYTAVRRMIQAGYSERTIQQILDHHTSASTQVWIDRFNADSNPQLQD